MNLNELYKQAYYKNKYGMILCGDCVQIMRQMDDACIDLTVTSPPYDNLRTYNGYCFDFESVAKELYRVTKNGGVVVWVVGDATIKGSETGTSFKQALFFKECGFNLHDTMIYAKANPMPHKSKRYTPAFEYMFVFSKGKPKSFNPIKDKENKHFGSVFYGTVRTENGKTKRLSKACTTKQYGQRHNVWKISPCNSSKERTGHPAQFPEQLANDHIISWSNEGDTVLDCFMGSGTTHKMALLNNRRFIGFEISQEYIDIETQRLKECNLWRYDY